MLYLYKERPAEKNMSLRVFELIRLLFNSLSVQELMKKPTLRVPTSKHVERLAELEQTVAEQDISLCSLTEKVKVTTAELERLKATMETEAKRHAGETSK